MAAKKDDGRRASPRTGRRASILHRPTRGKPASQLTGTEVKSLREGQANIAESYASPRSGGLWLINAYIPEYQGAGALLPARAAPQAPPAAAQARRSTSSSVAVERQGMTIVPLELYFNARGIAKLKLAAGRRARSCTTSARPKQRDWNREKARLMREKG